MFEHDLNLQRNTVSDLIFNFRTSKISVMLVK